MAIWATPGVAGAQEIIELPGEDCWLEVDFEEVYRVGSALEEAWQEFGNIGRVGFDDAGSLHVFDSPGCAGRCRESGGRLHSRIRRRGEGPGEFHSALPRTERSRGS